MEKITKRNVYEALINYATEGTMEFVDKAGEKMELTPEDVKKFAENEIALLDKKAIKAKETAAKKRDTADELYDVVRSALTDEYATIADIAASIEGDDVTVSKITYRLNKLVAAGEAEKADVKVGGEDGKKTRTVKAYRLVTAE